MKYFLVGKEKVNINEKWKYENAKYLESLQKFMDKIDRIGDEELQNEVVFQMLECDRILTKTSEKMFTKMFLKGYRNAIYGIKKKN